MAVHRVLAQPDNVGIVSFVLGLLGLLFYWWTPLGIVLSLAGLIIGIVGWVMASTRSGRLGLTIAGTVISLAALIVDLVIAGQGLEIIKFSALR
jgi:hypothetical protein